MNKRKNDILEQVRQEGLLSIEVLSQTFGVATQTIRRDVNWLCEKGVLRRVHGGVTLPSSTQNIGHEQRLILHHQAKQAIAAQVVEQIPDYASLFLDIGTTTEAVAAALLNHKGLTVITNNLHVAIILSRQSDFEVIVSGGLVRGRDLGIIGENAIDFISQFKVDFGIIGISGIDDQGNLLDFDYREVRVTKAIMQQSRSVWLVTDHSKFGRDAVACLGNLRDIDAVFTDDKLDLKYQSEIRNSGARLFLSQAE